LGESTVAGFSWQLVCCDLTFVYIFLVGKGSVGGGGVLLRYRAYRLNDAKSTDLPEQQV